MCRSTNVVDSSTMRITREQEEMTGVAQNSPGSACYQILAAHTK